MYLPAACKPCELNTVLAVIWPNQNTVILSRVKVTLSVRVLAGIWHHTLTNCCGLTSYSVHSKKNKVTIVLASAGIELIFFLVAGIVLCLGFSIRRMLITHWCLQLLLSSVQTKSRIFQLLMPSQQEGWRGTRSWEGTQPGQLTQTGQRGIPYHVTSCPVYKLGTVGLGGLLVGN